LGKNHILAEDLYEIRVAGPKQPTEPTQVPVTKQLLNCGKKTENVSNIN
jgi:hypothetical protein